MAPSSPAVPKVARPVIRGRVRGRGASGVASRPQWLGLAFVAPSGLFILILFVMPLGMTAWMSLHDWPLLNPPRFDGLDNYRELLGDSQFWGSVRFTLLYTALVTVAIFAAAFPLALLADAGMRWSGLFRTVFFMPVVIGFAAASTLWLWLLNPDQGVFAHLLTALHLVDEAPRPLEGFWSALAVVVLMVTWKTAGFTMVILLTGLQAISREVLEAARMDGAGPIQRFLLVTLPLMRPSLALALVLCISSSMLAADQFFIITQGGPANATISVVYDIYLASFSSYRLGYGAAMSIVLLVILMALSSLQLALLRPRGDR